MEFCLVFTVYTRSMRFKYVRNENISRTVYLITCKNISHSVPIYGYINVVYSAVIINLIMVLPVLVLNFLIAFIICKTKALYNPSNVLLAFQAICDMLVAVFGIPGWTTILLLAITEKHDCFLFLFTVFTSHVFAFLSVLFVSCNTLDRYVAIFKPFFYADRISMNIKGYLKGIVILCAIVIVITALSFSTIDRGLDEIISLITVPLLCLFNFYVHLKIYHHVKCVRDRVKHNRIKPASIVSNAANSIHCSDTVLEVAESKRKRKKPTNIRFLTFMMLVSLCACYTPYLLIVMLWTMYKSMKYYTLINVLYMWSYTIVCFKSLLNPVILLYQSRVLRKHLYDIFSKDIT